MPFKLNGLRFMNKIRPDRESSLRRQLLHGLSAVLLGIFMLSTIVIGYVVYRYEQNIWEGRLTEATANAAYRVSDYLHQQERSLILLDAFSQDDLRSDPTIVNEILRSNPVLLEVIYLDASGKVIAHAPEDASILGSLSNVSQTPWFQEAREGKFYSGDMEVSSQNEPYMVLSLPISNKGVAAARLDIKQLWKKIDDIRFGNQGLAYLVNHHGLLVAYPNQEIALRRTSITDRPGLDRLLLTPGIAWNNHTLGLEGSQVASAKAPIQGTNWLVISEVPLWEVYSTSRNVWLFLICGSIILYFLSTNIAKRILERLVLQPMYRLQIGARQVGQGNLEYRVVISRKDEIGKVAETFNQMAASLSEREKELAAQTAALSDLNEQLEDRVHHRTAELTQVNSLLRREVADREMAEEALRMKTAQQEQLIVTARQLTASLEMREVLSRIAQGARDILNAAGCTVYLLEDDENTLTPVVALDPLYMEEILSSPITVAQSLNGQAVKAMHGLIFNDPLVANESFQVPGTPLDQEERIIVAPLIVDGKVLGTLSLNRTLQPFTENDLALTETFAAYASTALKNAQVLDTMQREVAERRRAEEMLAERNEALRQSEAEMRALFSAMNDVVIVYDRTGGYQKIASANTSLLYKPPDDMIGKRLEEVLPEDKAELLLSRIQLALDMQQTVYLDYSLSIEEREIWFAAAISPMQADRVILVAHDITERKQMEKDLQESQERYVLAIQGANDGLWDWDLKKDQIYYSPRWKSMLGYVESEIGDSPEEWLSRIHPEDLDQMKINLSAHLQGLTPHFESEHRMQHKDGTYRWVLTRGLAVRAVDIACGSPTRGPSLSAYRMAGSQSDITDRKRAEDQLLHDAFHDALTDLPNRALFLDRLERAIERTIRHPDNPYAVMLLDLDRFKVINESLSHTLGDQLLISVANRLKVCLRGSDTAARVGGDEFVILLEDFHDTCDVVCAAERILCELKLPFHLNEHKVVTSASMGIVVSGVGYERPADVLRDADIALYRAKAQGRDRYVMFEPSLRTLVVAKLELESELRGALERQELQLHYQEIRSLKYDSTTGFEALLRWKSPTRGNVPPVEFIPVAEETGLIVPIGEWVLREACRQLRKWQDEFPNNPPLTINVNISGIQFSQPGFVDLVKQILIETDLNANDLRLEITESVFMENAEQANRILLQLRDLGVHLQIDDFGTGYSSLAYLQQFPISTIKIDRSFISRITANDDGSSDSAEIVKTIVNLARELGMDSIAEGVETGEQLRALKQLGCEYGQGFYLARPIDSRETEIMLAKSFGLIRKLQSGEYARRL